MSHFMRQKWLQPLWLLRKQLSFLIAAAALLLAGTPARADVWGYVDGQGVAYFSAERLDERYQLFFRGGESFDTSRGGNASAGAYGGGMPGAPPQLLGLFDVLPHYKAGKHFL